MTLDEMIAAVRGLKKLPEETAKIAGERLQTAVKATASAGQDPDGKPWPLKKDGTQALRNVAAAISLQVLGATVRLELKAPEAWHHFGAGPAPMRRVLPDAGAGVPENVAKIVRAAGGQAFDRLTK